MHAPGSTESIQDRVQALDWDAIGESLWRDGYARTPPLLRSEECRELVETYDHSPPFRSHIVMARFGFGRGEYKYFKYPLPNLVQDLREQFYLRLAPWRTAGLRKLEERYFLRNTLIFSSFVGPPVRTSPRHSS